MAQEDFPDTKAEVVEGVLTDYLEVALESALIEGADGEGYIATIPGLGFLKCTNPGSLKRNLRIALEWYVFRCIINNPSLPLPNIDGYSLGISERVGFYTSTLYPEADDDTNFHDFQIDLDDMHNHGLNRKRGGIITRIVNRALSEAEIYYVGNWQYMARIDGIQCFTLNAYDDPSDALEELRQIVEERLLREATRTL